MGKGTPVKVHLSNDVHLLLKVIAFLENLDHSGVLTHLILKEASRLGVTVENAKALLEESTKPLSTLGERIRAERVRQEMSQAKLGARFGLSQSYVAFIESGKRRIPKRILAPLLKWLAKDG